MKFDTNEYLKHKSGMDAFIRVKSVMIDNGARAIIYAYWMVQGTSGHWYASDVDRFFIKEDQYDNWLPYKPVGELKYV